MLFVGEAPPASGRFFYQADSGLYRAIRDAFVDACPNIAEDNFLKSFQELGCYLVDLCGKPVDRMNSKQRRRACRDGEVRLARDPETASPQNRDHGSSINRGQREALRIPGGVVRHGTLNCRIPAAGFVTALRFSPH